MRVREETFIILTSSTFLTTCVLTNPKIDILWKKSGNTHGSKEKPPTPNSSRKRFLRGFSSFSIRMNKNAKCRGEDKRNKDKEEFSEDTQWKKLNPNNTNWILTSMAAWEMHKLSRKI